MNLLGKTIFAFLLVMTLMHCAWTDENESIKIIGNYYIGWSDLESNRTIHKNINSCTGCSNIIIDNYVFSVGNKDQYIFAKQQDGNNPLNTNYFLIDTLENYNNSKGIYGPLNEKDFELLLKKLDLKKITFNKTFTRLN